MALLAFLCCDSPRDAAADRETRTISFRHIHTHEELTITYKRNGRYDDEALNRINQFFRDWREQEAIKMDPHLIDLLWEVHREVRAPGPIAVICGYRSPQTNALLRSRSTGVAKHSQHMLGKAIDFFIPGVSLETLRAAGLRAQRGGVGYYPAAGEGFVHMDTGGVRHWPRMPDAQLANILKQGPLSTQVASDDKSVKPVAVAQATTSASPNFFARLFGVSPDKDEVEDRQTAAAQAPARTSPARAAAAKPEKPATAAVAAAAAPKPDKTPAAPVPRSEKVVAAAVPPPKLKPANEQVAAASSAKPAVPAGGGEGMQLASASAKTVKLERVKPIAEAARSESAKPETSHLEVAHVAGAPGKGTAKAGTYQVASADTQPVRPAQAASLVTRATANDVISSRGFWQGLPSADTPEAAQLSTFARTPTPRPPAAVPTGDPDPNAASSAAPWPTPESGNRVATASTLAYAAPPEPVAQRTPAPILAGLPRPASAAAPAEVTTVAVRQNDDKPAPARPHGSEVVQVGDRFNDPWMRAMIVSPSAQGFLRTTLYGEPNFRNLAVFLQKPSSVVSVTFSGDPTFGASPEKFSGTALAFMSTAKFSAPRTASLR